jgi:hypothetical protein
VAAALLAAGCSSDDGASEGGSAGGDGAASGEAPAEGEPLEVTAGAPTLLPFPDDRYTAADDRTDTGLRVDLPAEALPVNVDGVPVDPSAWNLSDGFSPGGPLLAVVPGIDLEATGAAPITDIGASLDDGAPIVVVDADTGERVPYFAELDDQTGPVQTAGATVPADEPVLFIRPAHNFAEGHRIVVGLRNLQDADGGPIEPTPAFTALRDNRPTERPEVEDRREVMDQVFTDLADAGVDRSDLTLAWGFTVASERGLSERMLHIRDDAFAELGDGVPTFTVTDATDNPEPGVLRRIQGTVEVPLYLTGEGQPGSRFNGVEEVGDLPQRNGTMDAPFLCIVPEGAEQEPALPSLYGHGLLGSRGEVAGAGVAIGEEQNVASCAVDWIGMSTEDVGNVAAILQDFSTFNTLADRLQQGFLNFLWLGRAMTLEDGLVSDPAFQGPDGQPLLDTGELVFVGNSQGGILGPGLTAVAQDWTRAVFGVGAANYSTLLDRSVDYIDYAPVGASAYPDRTDQIVAIALAQMLWDRGEANGYSQHLTSDPYEGTPEHQVLLFEAFGDHQVPNIGSENLARTAGLAINAPGLEDGRHPSTDPWFGLDEVADEEDAGAVLVVWDFGTPTWPIANVPNEAGEDPHGAGADSETVRTMVADFLRGSWQDPCGGDPCQTPPLD